MRTKYEWAREHITESHMTKSFYKDGVLYSLSRDNLYAQLSKRSAARWTLLCTFVIEAKDTMAKKAKKKPIKKKKWAPVKKPEGSHMPICSRLNCKRIVSDARKTLCDKCNKKNDFYNRDNWFDKYVSGTEC